MALPCPKPSGIPYSLQTRTQLSAKASEEGTAAFPHSLSALSKPSIQLGQASHSSPRGLCPGCAPCIACPPITTAELSDSDPCVKPSSKPPLPPCAPCLFAGYCFWLLFDGTLCFWHLTTWCLGLLVHCLPSKIVNSISMAFLSLLGTLPRAVYSLSAQ